MDECVAFQHTAIPSAEPWSIERMRHCADKTRDSASRQVRIGVKRDDVAHPGEIWLGDVHQRHKRGALRATQQLVQLMQLSSSCAPTPSIFLRSHSKHACDERGKSVPRRQGPDHSVGSVSAMPSTATRQQIVIIRQAFAGCIQPIGEQRKVQVSIGIREVMNFQPLDLLLDFSGVVSSMGTTTIVRKSSGTPLRNPFAAAFAVQAKPSLSD